MWKPSIEIRHCSSILILIQIILKMRKCVRFFVCLSFFSLRNEAMNRRNVLQRGSWIAEEWRRPYFILRKQLKKSYCKHFPQKSSLNICFCNYLLYSSIDGAMVHDMLPFLLTNIRIRLWINIKFKFKVTHLRARLLANALVSHLTGN